MNKHNRGSALAWAIVLFLVATVMLVCILPLAMASITDSERTNHNQQSYYTAKSVVYMINEYIISDSSNDPARTIIAKAEAAGEEGYEWTVDGLDEDMGTCKVNVRKDGNTLYIKGTANYLAEENTMTAVLKYIKGSTDIVSAEPIVTGVYDGIKADMIEGVLPYNAADTDKLENATNVAVISVTNSDIHISHDFVPEDEEAEDGRGLSSALIVSKDATFKYNNSAGTAVTKRYLLYSKAGVTYHSIIDKQNIKSMISTDGDFILDNPENDFTIVNNVMDTNVEYVLYTGGMVKLGGKVVTGNEKNNNCNFTAGKIVLQGHDKDDDGGPDIQVINAGVYGENLVKLDDTIIKIKNQHNGIVCDGPIVVTNVEGPTTVVRYKNTNSAIKSECSYFEAISTSDDPITLDSGIYSVSWENYNYPAGENTSAKYAEAKTLEELKAQRDAAIAAGEEYDELKLYEAKEYFGGDIYIDATTRSDGAEGVPAQITTNELFSNRTITIKGNVVVNGEVKADKVYISGGATINGIITANEVYIENNATTVTGNIRCYDKFQYKTDDGKVYDGINTMPIDEQNPSTEEPATGTTTGVEGTVEQPGNVNNDTETSTATETIVNEQPSVEGAGEVIDINGQFPAILHYSSQNGLYMKTGNSWRYGISLNRSTNTVVPDRYTRFVEEDEAKNSNLNLTEFDKITTKTTLSVSNILSLNHIDDINAGETYKVYNYSGNCSINSLKIDSYGDTYIEILDGQTVDIGELTAEYEGNVYFIVRKGGTLRINYRDNKEGVVINAQLYGEEGSNIILGNGTTVNGKIDAGTLLVGENVSFIKTGANSLAGGIADTNSNWRLVEYINK